ncbi:hypothetical protein AMST5_04101 [freshwater sediment metagenome]|uniref:Uncharacterized protein n=1 Tax=freshwater sediment metagenome TaxID=556182 RepID=A0AA48M6L2_9ZZZZ
MANEEDYPSSEHAWFWDLALDDAAVQSLPPALFKAWFNFTVSAFRHDGIYPSARVLAFESRSTPASVARQISALISAGVIVERRDGELVPFGFSASQNSGPPQDCPPPPPGQRLRLVTSGGRS